MSALVDIWTSEQRKLREKGQTLLSGGPSQAGADSTQIQMVKPPAQSNPTGLVQAFSKRVMRFKFAPDLPSEASLFMLLDIICA